MRSVLIAAAALALLPAAAAQGAADRELSLGIGSPPATYSSEQAAGLVLLGQVADAVGKCSPTYGCDATLVHTEDYGDLTASIAGKGVQGQPTMVDADLHVYVSNANGSIGTVLDESTTDQPNETVSLADLPAGDYLVMATWSAGVGTVDGTISLGEPSTPTDTPPAFVPAENAGTPPARQHTFAGATPFQWTGGPGVGVSDAQPAVGCRTVNCDFTLFKVNEAGTLQVNVAGVEPTIADLDIHIYASNKNGFQGGEVGSGIAFGASESAFAPVEPGYYLMQINSTGIGTHSGTATWAAPEPEVPEE